MTHDHWHGVEIRHLAALSAVARTRSFRGAAEELGYVQSAVSQQIAVFEQLVGERLLKRSRGSKDVEVTEVGRLLLSHADDILTRLHAAHADLLRHAADGDETRTLRVGVFPCVAAAVLPSLLRRLQMVAPEVRVVTVEAACDRALFERVADCEVDVAFADLPLLPGPFEGRRVLRDGHLLLVPAGSEWGRFDGPPTAEALARLPLIHRTGNRASENLETWFGTHGVEPNVVHRSDSDATVRALVAAGLGVAIVRRLGNEAADERLTSVDLGDLIPPRRLAVIWHEGRQHGEELRTFCDLAVNVGRTLSEPPSEHRPVLAQAA